MTVKELIKALQQYPEDMEVGIVAFDAWGDKYADEPSPPYIVTSYRYRRNGKVWENININVDNDEILEEKNIVIIE